MWLMTNFGFFSIVQKPGDQASGNLTIRARVRADLQALKERYLPGMGEISSGQGSDYRWRAQASRAAIASALQRAVLDIDYSNFKSSVAGVQGAERASVYHGVWAVLEKLQTKDAEEPRERKTAAAVHGGTPVKPRTAYGGVLFNDRGQVLLVEPKNHFDNTVWTWPKGKPAGEQYAEAAALREVREETGYAAEIMAPIRGSWTGTTGSTEYFLMRPLGAPGEHDDEIASIQWVSPSEAPVFIGQTTKSSARKRDLEVLAAALEAYKQQAHPRTKRE